MLIPYAQHNGTWSVADEKIVALYHELDAEGSIDLVFRDGMQASAEFLAFLKNPQQIPVLQVLDRQVVGVAWLNQVVGNSAQTHFLLTKACWGGHNVEMGHRVVKYWFSFPGADGPLLDVLLGNTPARLKLATRFIKRLGFVALGTIPYLDGDGMVVSYQVNPNRSE